jgi:prevent-host-death family protein
MKESTLKHVGAREFRQHLADYMNSDTPIAITKHGLTVGYYIPARPQSTEAEREALARAAEKLHAYIEEQGISVEELVEEFDARGRVDKEPARS